jgi:hypothetical protein
LSEFYCKRLTECVDRHASAFTEFSESDSLERKFHCAAA